MKAILVCGIFVILAVSIVQADHYFRQIIQDCMQETKLTENELKEFMAMGLQGNVKDNLKCYTKCLMEKQGHMTNGQFNAQAMLETLKSAPQIKSNIEEITMGVQACKDMKGTDACDTAFKVTMCLKDHKSATAKP